MAADDAKIYRVDSFVAGFHYVFFIQKFWNFYIFVVEHQ